LPLAAAEGVKEIVTVAIGVPSVDVAPEIVRMYFVPETKGVVGVKVATWLEGL
jgi:hypothetical protein